MVVTEEIGGVFPGVSRILWHGSLRALRTVDEKCGWNKFGDEPIVLWYHRRFNWHLITWGLDYFDNGRISTDWWHFCGWFVLVTNWFIRGMSVIVRAYFSPRNWAKTNRWKKNLPNTTSEETSQPSVSLISRNQLRMRGGTITIVLSWLVLNNGWLVQGLKRTPTWGQHSAGLDTNPCRKILPELRGGYRYFNRNEPIELNPEYIHYKPPPPGGAIEDHEEWLKEQEGMQSQMTTGFQSFQPQQRQRRDSIFDDLKRYVLQIHNTSPCVAWTAISCIIVFILWQMPSIRPSLVQTFVCSRKSLKRTAGLSSILSAVSHVSLYHLLGNLVTLLGIAPGVARNVTKPLWPLFLGSALCSNALFVGFRRYGSCIGLSGVTMSVVAVQARAAPERVYQYLLAGVLPVSLPAKYMLYVLLAVSFLGSFVHDSRISHLSHLGGLIFGILYFEFNVKRTRKQSMAPSWI